MNKILGFLCAFAAIASLLGGAYVAVLWMLVGGIVDLINEVKAEQTNAYHVAFGIVKVAFCALPFYAGILLTSLFAGLASVFFKNK